MKKLHAVQAALVAAILVPGLALATYTPQDYTGITTSFTAELGAAMPVVLTVFGTVFAIGVAFRLFKKARSG